MLRIPQRSPPVKQQEAARLVASVEAVSQATSLVVGVNTMASEPRSDFLLLGTLTSTTTRPPAVDLQVVLVTKCHIQDPTLPVLDHHLVFAPLQSGREVVLATRWDALWLSPLTP